MTDAEIEAFRKLLKIEYNRGFEDGREEGWFEGWNDAGESNE